MQAIDFEKLIDENAISWRQKRIFVLCCALAMVEGFDLQVMALVAPEIAERWGIDKVVFGLVFSAGLFASMSGGFLISLLGGRVGPKTSMQISVILFGITTLLTAFATNVTQLVVMRAVAGVGLGAAVPGLIAIVSGYTPKRLRSQAVTITAASQVLGAVVGGTLAAQMIPALGWQSAFILGGIVPLLLVCLAQFVVPESAHWLLLRRGDHATVGAILHSMNAPVPPDATYSVPVPPGAARISIAGLLTPSYRVGTIAFWCTCVSAAIFFSLLINWLPTAVRDSGASISQAIMTSVILNAGGFCGAIFISRMMDHVNPYRAVSLGYLIGAVILVPMSSISELPPTLTFVVVFGVGLFGFGSYFCMTALQAHYFPSHLLNISVGCSMGFARAGAVVGPLVGSFILASGGHAREMFLVAAGFAIVAAGTATVMRRAASIRERSAEYAAP